MLTSPTPQEQLYQAVSDAINAGGKLVIIFDYDGTLTLGEYLYSPGNLAYQPLLEAIYSLKAAHPDHVIICVSSNKPHEQVSNLIGDIGVDLIVGSEGLLYSWGNPVINPRIKVQPVQRYNKGYWAKQVNRMSEACIAQYVQMSGRDFEGGWAELKFHAGYPIGVTYHANGIVRPETMQGLYEHALAQATKLDVSIGGGGEIVTWKVPYGSKANALKLQRQRYSKNGPLPWPILICEDTIPSLEVPRDNALQMGEEVFGGLVNNHGEHTPLEFMQMARQEGIIEVQTATGLTGLVNGLNQHINNVLRF